MNIDELAALLDEQAAAMAQTARDLTAAAQQLRSAPAHTPAQKTLLSLDEVCELTGLSLFSVRRLLEEGTLTEVRVGRRRLVSRASLEAINAAS